MQRLFTALILIFALPLVLVAEVQVLATTGMIADAVKNIGGTRVAVTSLMGPGVDPHLYKATHGDMKRLRSAEVVFYNGLHLEGKMVDILAGLARNKPCVAVAEHLEAKRLLYPEQASDQADPHLWFDVSLWSDAVSVIANTLSEFDPDNAGVYEAGLKQYQSELAELHLWTRSEIASIPKEKRVLLTAHDAFGYFGRAYDIEVKGLQGISTASEFGLFDVKQIVDTVLARKIKAVFVETSVSKKFVTALQEGVKARGGTLALGGELFSDAMGAEGTPEGTYTGMVRHNVKSIVHALK